MKEKLGEPNTKLQQLAIKEGKGAGVEKEGKKVLFYTWNSQST